MLKLERISHHNQIFIFVRDKQQLFTKPFLTALSAAFALHVLVFLLFHISPIKISWSNTTVSLAIVEADLRPAKDASVSADANHAIQQRSGLLEPQPSLPALQKVPAFSTVRQMDFFKLHNFTANPFTQIEREVYQAAFFEPHQSAKPMQPLTLVISGPIAESQIAYSGLDGARLSLLSISGQEDQQQRAVYSVLVKGDTGKVFWYEKKEKISFSTLEKILEQVVQDMKFEPNAKVPIISGEIEFHFYPEWYD